MLEASPAARRCETLPGRRHRRRLGAAAAAAPRPGALHARAPSLAAKRRKYFIGELDPCASIEFTRGCPWDCAFCSAWTFYGRSYRKPRPRPPAEDLASIREPNVFIVDDVAFIRPEHGMAIADEIERRGIRKRYYLETRADVLLRNREVFERWVKLGLRYMFLGIEAIDEEGLKRFIASASRWARTSMRSRWRASSASWWPSTSSPTRTGTSAASRSCASGRSTSRRSST